MISPAWKRSALSAAIRTCANRLMVSAPQSTEIWLGEIEERLDYEKWYCGHYHTEKKIARVEIMFENYNVFCDGNQSFFDCLVDEFDFFTVGFNTVK